MQITNHLSKELSKGKAWVLCSGTLEEYISSLSVEFFKYDIQRKIVENHFLDTLSKTIEEEMPMPAITLTSSVGYEKNSNTLELGTCEILDGLQRTFRLWAIWYMHRLSTQHNTTDTAEIYDLLSKDNAGKDILFTNVINKKAIRELYRNNGERINNIIEKYKIYTIVLNVWYGLTDEEIVKQMLILNAGQKSVTAIHQYELIYLRYFNQKEIELPAHVALLRQKEERYKDLSQNSRKVGMYALSTVMVAFQSYHLRKPLRVKRVNQLNFNDNSIPSEFSEGLVASALSNFIKVLYSLDSKISSLSDYARVWIAKDTTLSGIFAALGLSADPDSKYDDYTEVQDFVETLHTEDLDLPGFKDAYESLSSVSVNVGQAVRKAVFNGFSTYIAGHKIDWKRAFKSE
jgi:hypothetical protein